MKWIPISERLPPFDCAHVFWRAGNRGWCLEWFSIQHKEHFSKLYSHWLEITGPEEDFCEWRYTHDATTSDYESSCNYRLDVDEFKRYSHCPNCGRVIKEVK